MRFFIKAGLWIFGVLVCQYPSHSQQSRPLTDHWTFLKQDLGGIWEAVRPVGKGSPEAVPIWESVRLPHCVNATDAVDPDANYYQGPAWYRTILEIDNPYVDGRTVLHFEGAGQQTEVYLYTTKVGTHRGGYDEWTVDITDAVAAFKKSADRQKQFEGKIPISIRTDNSRDLEMIPSDLSDFNLYGGIYRDLNLVYLPPVSIDKAFVDAAVDAGGKEGTVQVRMRFYNPLSISEAKVRLKLLDPQGRQVLTAEQQFNGLEADLQWPAFTLRNPRCWSPDTPNLYRLELFVDAVGQHYTYSTPVGFRHIRFEEKGPFFLNGKRLLLKGTHRHEDHAGLGAALTKDLMRQEMVLIKQMGVNFIRLGHYQQSRRILDLCDSLGILVWEEIPWCRGGLGGRLYQEMAQRMLESMIDQHYNHPSVFIWGLGNENDWPGDFPEFDTLRIQHFMSQLNDLAHRLDPARKTAIRRCDFCKDIVDVYSPSIWAGWYRGIYTEYRQESQEQVNRVRHFLHVEWGGDSHAGRHSENPDRSLQQIRSGSGADERAGDASLYGGAARVSKDGDWSESYMINLFDWHLKEQETMPWLTGTAQWVFKDFSTPVRPENPVPYVNQKGVVARDLVPKESYYVFQSYWSQTPMVHIYGHSWPVRWGDEQEVKMLKVFSNCPEAELWLNGKSLGKRKRNSQDFPAAGLRWASVFQKGVNKVLVSARNGNRVVEDSISFIYQTEKWGMPSQLELKQVDRQGAIVTVQASMLDANGVRCLDAENFVRFGLLGDGRLIDNLGTADGSRYVQLYNGRARIKIDTRNGSNIVSVASDTISRAFLKLN